MIQYNFVFISIECALCLLLLLHFLLRAIGQLTHLPQGLCPMFTSEKQHVDSFIKFLRYTHTATSNCVYLPCQLTTYFVFCAGLLRQVSIPLDGCPPPQVGPTPPRRAAKIFFSKSSQKALNLQKNVLDEKKYINNFFNLNKIR